MDFYVFLEVSRRAVRFVADVTNVRIFTLMSGQMLHQIVSVHVVRFAELAYQVALLVVMAALYVALEIRPLTETFQAYLAHVRFLARMRFQVRQQFVFGFELRDAVLALVFISFVIVSSLDVAFQIRELRERSKTVFALVRLLLGVDANVARVGRIVAEHFVAFGTLERAFAGVASNMGVQIAFLAEATVAILAGKRFSAFVQLDVLRIQRLVGEAFAAVLALERFLLFVHLRVRYELDDRVVKRAAQGADEQTGAAGILMGIFEVLAQIRIGFEHAPAINALGQYLRVVRLRHVLVQLVLVGEIRFARQA